MISAKRQEKLALLTESAKPKSTSHPKATSCPKNKNKSGNKLSKYVNKSQSMMVRTLD